ncbi:MAG: hypothetical protein QNJ90_08355 [Planctomycetota bacterium]|nr:hypothetical protein [Planctomycetota bacterium]
MRSVLGILGILGVLGVLVLTGACGGEDGLDRTDAIAVFRATMAAVHDGDWPRLKELLTDEARRETERTLVRLRDRLRDPQEPLRAQLGDEEALDRALGGGPADMLRLCVQLMPRERTPEARGSRETALGRTFLYATAAGTLRPVRLVERDGVWYVADLQL